MIHHYILIEITTILDEDQQALAQSALLELGERWDRNPSKMTHLRPSLDGQKIIVELDMPAALTKQQACDKLAELLPWTSEQISNNATFTKFAGSDWKERGQATVNYLGDNKEEWGEV